MVTSNLPAVHIWQTASFQICFSNMKHVISYYEVHQVFMNKLCESDENVSSTKCLWLCAWKKAVIETRTHTVSCCDTWWLTCCFARALLPANNFNNINYFWIINNLNCVHASRSVSLDFGTDSRGTKCQYCYWPIFTIFIDISVGICKWESPSYLSVTESVVLVYV